MPRRKIPLVKDEIFHVYNTSIAGFKIFNHAGDYDRMMEAIAICRIENFPYKFSLFKKLKTKPKLQKFYHRNECKRLVEIIAYCLMPTHIHFILKGLKENGITKFMTLLLKSYSQYFNIRHKRKGPLWEGRFKNVLVENDYQFTHLTRYIHLNPVTAYLVEDPKDWKYSSYREYMGLIDQSEKLCDFSNYLDMNVKEYKKFVKDQIGYQRELASIKYLTLE